MLEISQAILLPYLVTTQVRSGLERRSVGPAEHAGQGLCKDSQMTLWGFGEGTGLRVYLEGIDLRSVEVMGNRVERERVKEKD